MDDSFKNFHYHWKNRHRPVVSHGLLVSLFMYRCYMSRKLSHLDVPSTVKYFHLTVHCPHSYLNCLYLHHRRADLPDKQDNTNARSQTRVSSVGDTIDNIYLRTRYILSMEILARGNSSTYCMGPLFASSEYYLA